MYLGKFVALIAVVSASLLGGCTTGVPASPISIDKSRTFNASFDVVWQATIDSIGKMGFKATTLNKSEGLIETIENTYSESDANEGLRGSVMGNSDRVLNRSVKLSIFVTSPSADTTSVQVNTTMEMRIVTGNGSQAFPGKYVSEKAYSNGKIEKSVLDGIANRIIEIPIELENKLIDEQNRKNDAAALKRQIEEDEVLGYKHMLFSDFQLDSKTMPLGKRLKITGFYQVTGQLETLVETLVGTRMPNAYRLFLLTENSPRETRKQLLVLRNGACGVYGICRMTVLGHISKCDVTWYGNFLPNTTCIVVDEIRGN
jgi:hypothetical protein